MSYEPDQYAAFRGVAASRTSVPGVLLIILGVLNLLAALWSLYTGYQTLQTPPAEFRRQYEEQMRAARDILRQYFPAFADEFDKQKLDAEEAQKQHGMSTIAAGVVHLVVGLVIVMGGMRMRTLQSYGLAVTAAILAALPCFSVSGCCCLGEIVGIWAFIVLMNAEVRAAFQ